ncbi:unnamed protein product [Aspergillus oryzae RIB40]|uniref:DNA, SC010 n=1 Tax=Aspergillus oryzae (strain ATCC 42149 / RIB 40) TaxID=510516 RepID=Q2TXV0_ASPOR|nr:unnamed protein product [Aspergillus oryzae RIB40]BAE65923.1 unnamed protein product [Aspergillus oryzae RIB40]
MDPISLIGAIGVAYQVVEITIDAIDYWKRTGDVADDIIMMVARLDMIRARIKSWSFDWGMREQRHLKHPKFRDYGHLALQYLVIIQRRLVRFSEFEAKYTGLFAGARSRRTGSVSRIAAVAAIEQTATNEGHVSSEEELLTQLKSDVGRLNRSNMLERWLWARKDKRGQMMVEHIDTLVKDLEDFFPPPRSDAAGAIVFNLALSSSDTESLQALLKLEAMPEADDNYIIRDVSNLASLKIIAANLGQRAARAKDQTLRWRSITTEEGNSLSLEPCVDGREIAQWRPTTRGEDTEIVLVEWKNIPVSLPREQKTQLDARIYDLGKMLQAADKPAKLLTLDCIGIVQKPVSDSSDAHLPDGVVDLAAPRLAGFEYSRLDEPGALTENTTDFRDHNLYRHPQHRGLPVSDCTGVNNQVSRRRNAFTYKADLYSLGVVLLEAGLWRTAAEIVAGSRGANEYRGDGYANQGNRNDADDNEDEVRSAFLRLIPTLRRTMGPIYADVVYRCLTGKFEPEDDEALETVPEAFYVNGVQPLDSCVV